MIWGDDTLIELTYKGEPISTVISTEDLEKVMSISGRWYAMNVGGKKCEKIYVGTTIGGVTIYLHQWLVKNPPKTVVDHRNHDTLDNRRENLFMASFAENCQNRKGAQRNNHTSGCRNVYRNKNGTWYVRLTKNGEAHHIGTYSSVEEANLQAIAARKQYYGIWGNRNESKN